MPKSAQATPPAFRNWIIALAAAATATLAAAPALGDAGAALPPGPKQTLAAWAGDDITALGALLGRTLTAEEWRAELSGISEESALAALADYLALNTPAEIAGEDVASAIAALPLDGKELFVLNCLSCHGGDSYFLQQDKTAEEWMGIFEAPYHRRLLTEGVERETFSTYAAATTPLALDTVPEALQDRAE